MTYLFYLPFIPLYDGYFLGEGESRGKSFLFAQVYNDLMVSLTSSFRFLSSVWFYDLNYSHYIFNASRLVELDLRYWPSTSCWLKQKHYVFIVNFKAFSSYYFLNHSMTFRSLFLPTFWTRNQKCFRKIPGKFLHF